MPVLDVDVLREYLKEKTAKEESLQRALEAAEALAAAYIGTETLVKHYKSETWHPRLDTRVLATIDGPVTSVTSVTVNGDDVTANTGYTYWSLRLQDEVGNGDTVEATYTAGWDPASIPQPIRQAVLMTAASIYARPDAGVARIVNPTLAEVYRSDYLSRSAKRLLDRYRAPGVVL